MRLVRVKRPRETDLEASGPGTSTKVLMFSSVTTDGFQLARQERHHLKTNQSERSKLELCLLPFPASLQCAAGLPQCAAGLPSHRLAGTVAIALSREHYIEELRLSIGPRSCLSRVLSSKNRPNSRVKSPKPQIRSRKTSN